MSIKTACAQKSAAPLKLQENPKRSRSLGAWIFNVLPHLETHEFKGLET